MDSRALLEWQLAAGVDEIITDTPNNYFVVQFVPPQVAVKETPLHLSPIAASEASRELADNCRNLDELEEAVRNFNGCAIKKTATKTVFSDGNRQARIMLIGEAPGAQEDIQGIPFCGASGILLDKMLLAIGLNRSKVYISNTIFWRPPGNRQPSPEEIATCLPFVEKHIALINPSLLILSGGTATSALLRKDQSLSRLRGKLYDYSNIYLDSPIKTAIIYHPSYLLRQPLNKKQAWQDLLMISRLIEEFH